MSEEVNKYIEAVKDALFEAAKEFADKEEVREFLTSQAKKQGTEYHAALTATSPAEKKEAEDNLAAIVGQNKSEVGRLTLAADDLVRARLEAAAQGVGNLLLNLLRGGVGE